MRELLTNNNIRVGILLDDDNTPKNESNASLFGGGGGGDTLGLNELILNRNDSIDLDQNINNRVLVSNVSSSKIEDSLTKSFKHKEYSIFKSMSLTSATNNNNSTNNSNYYYFLNQHQQYHNNYFHNQNMHQRHNLPLQHASISLYNNNSNKNRSFNPNSNSNLTHVNQRFNPILNTPYYFNNNKRQNKMISNQTHNNISTNNNINKKTSTNISSTSSLSSSSASSLKSSSNLQKSSSSSPFRRLASFHNTNKYSNNNRNFSISPIQKPQQTQSPQYTAKDFSLDQEQFDLIKTFFDKLQQYSYLKVKLVKEHMLASIINNSERRQTDVFTSQMNEEDVTRTLNLIDFDKDGLFNFENFCDYLNLFLANRRNLKEKLKAIINAKRLFFASQTRIDNNNENQNSIGSLGLEEIKQIVDFLDLFYNSKNQTDLFSFENNNQPIDLDEFLSLMTKRIEEHLFLRTP